MAKYLSLDIEATGLDEHDLIIEFAVVPFCTDTKSIDHELSFHRYVQCPPFEILKPKLNEWVIKNNETLIRKANLQGLTLQVLKQQLTEYLTSAPVKKYFPDQIILFGKSMNAIDLPFLNRDLGYDFMRKHFSHRVLDLTSHVLGLIDMKILPPETKSGSHLMKHLGMGDVAHTALEDAINTAKMYFKLIDKATTSN
jgi:DNA polymerase-3 subunit epsilon